MNKIIFWENKISASPIFNLGFRIFFCSATLISIVCMGWWLGWYGLNWSLPFGALLTPILWHGHEMVFGFAVGIVGGFLLTAVQNWTGVPMPFGKRLFRLWLLWFMARLIFLFFPQWAFFGGILDTLFSACLTKIVYSACKQADGQLKRQSGIIAKLVLYVCANLLFLVGLILANTPWGYQLIALSIYFSLFVTIGLVMTIGRRVIPFFTKNALLFLGYDFEPKNDEQLDGFCLKAFLAFFFLELFFKGQIFQYLAGIFALMTAVLNFKRLWGWYHQAIWRLPLLWTLFLSFLAMILGFVLYACQNFFPSVISQSVAMHAFAVGGIGLMGLSMMGRVSLGHSGRNIHLPPKALFWALGLMLAVFWFRIVMVIFVPAQSKIWLIHAQVGWILAFGLLAFAYVGIWFRPRADGKNG